MSIEIKGITKRFGDFVVLDAVDLTIEPRELVVILGPSGSGKTTLLRTIAGLEWPDSGDILLDGQSASASSARHRRVGFVFQHYALFRHMTVFENVAFGLRVRKRGRPSEADIRKRVGHLLELVQLGELGDRLPAQLSGGQRQRVALVRALAIEPRVLLLDEPFGALDAQVRKELRLSLRRVHDELGTATAFVTHDQEEALELADRVAIMNGGRIEQIGTPAGIYSDPANEFVIRFLGNVNELPCRVASGRVVLPGATVDEVVTAAHGDGPATLYVRHEDVSLVPVPAGQALVRTVHTAGPVVRIAVELPGEGVPVEAALSHEAFDRRPLVPGMRVGVRFRRGRLFPVNAVLPSVTAMPEPGDIDHPPEISSSSARPAAMAQ
jgi:sulfate transport system ATP-binding protein